jgi:hypothetical protein
VGLGVPKGKTQQKGEIKMNDNIRTRESKRFINELCGYY